MSSRPHAANTLGLDVIGEGVETVEQQDILESLGCDRIQGYLIGHPAPEVHAARRGRDAAA
jgi:EAL domain-containing protein (putative c-di-GMP-specific phosphodiesterase class I)